MLVKLLKLFLLLGVFLAIIFVWQKGYQKVSDKTDIAYENKQSEAELKEEVLQIKADESATSLYSDNVLEEMEGLLLSEKVFVSPCGKAVNAFNSGVVTEINGENRWNAGYGNYIKIIIGEEREVLFTHLDDIFVDVGDLVTKGSSLGTTGKTGLLPLSDPCFFGFINR